MWNPGLSIGYMESEAVELAGYYSGRLLWDSLVF